ncbi:MAG: phosphate ABC transporter substrate-binding protein PstS [Synechococcales cyanobacterium CRU_2_2]|nr:phosphate ABC transporter substrate-binding protein PstS [Synechococcales cyanobacterium CRU_2_2]
MKVFSLVRQPVRFAALAALSISAVACSAPTTDGPTASGAAQSGGEASGSTVSLSGAGASFPAPLYQRWFSEYQKVDPSVQVSYQSVGSGAGVEQFLAGTVDFGATDSPLKDEEKTKAQEKYTAPAIQLPLTAGSVVFAFNLPGVEALKLSREAYCGIVTGKVSKWNDPLIAKGNDGATLPDKEIGFVYRSDGSGTTSVFTKHLAEACPDWTLEPGKSVEWTVGSGAKGNEGITAQVQQTEGAVGYVEYAYAKQNGLSMAAIENKSGSFIEAGPEAGGLAFEGAELPEDFALSVADPENAGAYPITSLTWILLKPKYDDPTKTEALKKVLTWALNDGQAFSEELGYVAMPPSVKAKVEEAIGKL